MHFDALTLACMCAELNAFACPGRVQQVLLVDDQSIGMEVYAQGARRQLLLCADPQAARIQLVSHKLRRGVDQETPLLLLLRKYVRDAGLVAVRQPDPTERVAQFAFENKTHGPTTLVVELIGRQSNLLLLRPDGRILDCLHRSAAPGEGQRVLLPGQRYALPPALDKAPPLDDGSPTYYMRLAATVQKPGKLWKALVEGVAGLSPTAAREVAWRVAGDAEAPAQHVEVLALAAALQGLWLPVTTQGWEPGVTDDGGKRVAFSPYRLHFRGVYAPLPSLSEAVEAYFAQPDAGGPTPVRDPYAAQRARVQATLAKARRQIARTLSALAGDEPAPGEAARLRTSAEWLLALSSQVAPGQRELQVPLEEGTLHIALDPSRTPVEQAERWFKRAGKLDRAAIFIPQRRSRLEQDLAFLDQLALDLEGAANQPEIAAVGEELRKAGLSRSPVGKAAAPSAGTSGGLLRFRSHQGLEIVVGRNARQNERVTFAIAHADDPWLHARGVPGAHVVVRLAGRQADEATLRAAAQLAAFHSGVRGENAAAVIVTRRRWVSRAPGGKTGQVLVEKEEVLRVPAAMPEDVAPISDKSPS